MQWSFVGAQLLLPQKDAQIGSDKKFTRRIKNRGRIHPRAS